jgi:hypothetical protein
MASFTSLSSVVPRLDLLGSDDEDIGDWWRVREPWALCAIRGILAHHLIVQLTAVAHPDRSRPYQYADGDQILF